MLSDCIGFLIPFVIIGVIIYAIVKMKEAHDIENSRQRAHELEEQHRKEDEELARQKAKAAAAAIEKQVTDIETKYRQEIFDFFMHTHDPYYLLASHLSQYRAKLCKAQNEFKIVSSSRNAHNCFNDRISKLDDLREKLNKHANTTRLTLFHEPEEVYGCVYKPSMEKINGLDCTTAMQKLNAAKEVLAYHSVNSFMAHLDQLFAIDPYDLICCIWFFAMAKPYSASDFKLSLDIYNQLFRETIQDNPDIFAAQLYAKNELAGEDAVLNDIRDKLKGVWQPVALQVLASAMMWMQCYRAEEYILNYKLDNGMEMTKKEQERLHALANGGGNGPKLHASNTEGFQFDISPLTWNDDSYTSFFDNLSFQGNVLPYALAIRDSDNDLTVPSGIKMPDDAQLLKKLQQVFADEYDDTAKVSMVTCVAISDAGEEVFKGYVARCSDCPQMAVVVRIVKIGKHMNIKFYTLFVPQNNSAEEEQKQALALKNNLALTVNIWEKGLKDIILLAIQQLLNKTSIPIQPESKPDKPADNEPVF